MLACRRLASSAVLLLTVAALTGCGKSSSSSTPSTAATPPPVTTGNGPVAVGLSEWKVSPSVGQVKAGRVSFVAHDGGRIAHELVVLSTDRPAAGLGSGQRISEKGNVGEVGDVPAGATKRATIALKPGHYALVCNLPGHYHSGMHADFVVK